MTCSLVTTSNLFSQLSPVNTQEETDFQYKVTCSQQSDAVIVKKEPEVCASFCWPDVEYLGLFFSV